MTIHIELRKSDGRHIAIEADWPSHFSSNKPYRLNGPSHVRNALLQQRGFYDVLSVPFCEWWDLNDEKKQEYLDRSLLKRGIAG